MRTITLLFFVWIFSSKSHGGGCDPVTLPSGLTEHEGYLDFIPPATLKPFKDALPIVENSTLNGILRDPETIWYDERTMVYLYQDSIESVVGGRANCVGRKIGEDNASDPQIGKLLKFFGPDYRFLFPFRKAAGTDNTTNAQVLTFWSPPREGGKALPVKWWKMSSRGRWRWAFPIGTVFGEVLYEKAPDGQWYVFEIRTRKRYREGWAVDLFRPFRTASDLSQAVKNIEPQWFQSENLRQFITHLENPATLVANRWQSSAYGKVFPPIDSYLDPLPALNDWSLLTRLLRETTFISTEGAIWKSNGTRETYGPASQAEFSIVPKGYEMGMIPVNEVSCNRCHSETGRRLKEFEFDIILYGEVWGEDQIFTWHLFEPHSRIFGPWDDSDGSRKLNPRLSRANLLKNEKPSANDPLYKPLPTAFVPENRGNHAPTYTY